MTDRELQLQQTEVTTLDGPVELQGALPRAAIEAFARIRRRRDLVRSAVYARHQQQLLEQTYALLYRPPPRAAAAPRRGFVRVVSWNIQRGIHVRKVARYLSGHPDLRHADILLLNEVDLGMARSDNRDVAAELGRALGLGHVYGNSYLCLDHGDARDGAVSGENRESMHGNAILTRFPVARAENFSIAISKDKFHSSERRLGHKKALWAEVETPLGTLPVVAVHLDSYASALQRGEQMRDVLDKIDQRGLSGRVLLGGDLNSTTYDARSVGQIVGNLWRKLVRGGFPHAMHHYLHPQELYERPLFEQLERRGYDYRGLNAMEQGTTRYEVGSFESESKVSELLPGVAVSILRRKLRPWGGVAPLKVDWFAGRGVGALHGEGGGGDEPRPRSPTPFPRPTVDGTRLSDHDPILVDVSF